MIEEKSDNAENESILYEVLEYFVKKQEPELTKQKNDFLALPTPGTIKNALRYLNNRYSLPEVISQQISYTLPWKFAIGDKGRILALLQENIIEIRKSKDEYSSIIGRASVPKDAFPQWRKLAWSPDGSILALASSNGYISFYNSFGNNIFNISPKSVSQNPEILEAGDAIASMIFKKPRVKSDIWEYEFIRVSYSGLLKSYCISGNNFSENHEFSFGSFYRNGVNSVSYSEKLNFFYVAGNSVCQNLTCTASQIGLTCWRTLNDQPYYKLSVASQDIEITKSNFSIWNYIPVLKNKTQSIIFKTSISPNDQYILCLHMDGTISIWSLPNLKLQKQWKLSEQPNYNAVNPLKTMKFKTSLANISEYQPLDIGWWSDNTVIIARYSGSVSVCSIVNLENLLGNSPEFLYNYPQIAEFREAKGFLCLDCEVIVTSTKRNRDSNAEELSSDDEKDEDESKPATIFNYTTNIMQNVLYSITDIERFQPKRKRSKIFHKTYRLLGIKSTTPEELYSRKIEIEAYEEALTLAKKYNLDPDFVYQTQWRKSEFSVKAIQEHLSKVTKRSWVLNECVSRVPETLEATRELINFGLCGANLETLVAIGVYDNGKFTSAESDDEADLDENSRQLKQMQKINETLANINADSLTESQKELIQYRKKLLSHLDKLQTYEILLKSSAKFDKKFYEEFRQLSPVENAVKFAKSCNYQGVEIMFTYYGAQLMPHWLTIVSYFPETLNPEKYQKLLPECDLEGRLFLLDQQELRPKDWVERNVFESVVNLEDETDIDYIYEGRKSLLVYRDTELTMDLLQKWYTDRAYEIEHESRLVDNSLALVNIGKSRNIKNLEKLLFELETLDDLVYKVGLEELSLTVLEKLNDIEKIKLLMAKSNEKNFVHHVKTMLLPYSRRRKRYLDDPLEKDLLCDYLVYLSKSELTLTVKFFDSLKTSYDPEILDVIESVTGLATDCIYACNDTDMYQKAKVIFDATLTLSKGKEDDEKKYKELEKELRCLQILNKYEVLIPLHRLRDSRQDSSEAKTLLVQMSENLIKIYPQANEKNWSQMLNDLLDVQEQAFNCLDIETCFEICMLARLKSRLKSAIQGCSNLMEIKKSGRSHLKVSYERAIDFILEVSNSYFNNSKSLTDPDMDLAKECLHLINEDNERIREEYDLIESLQILNEFNINILPIQVRNTEERLKLIEDCLNNRRDGYKSKQKLLNLSKYLRVERKNNRLREGKVLNLIAKKALESRDYGFCSSVLKDMMKNNYQAAWCTARDLAYSDEFGDLQFRKCCIWFAVNHGPSDAIESLMTRANLLEVQILNADLERMMPVEDEQSIAEDNTDSEAFSTPVQENKEFVPKIVQTSTELVKSSAQMVTQSTFDLLRNARNKDFWTSKLNFNFLENSQKVIAEDEIIDTKTQEEVPKFPCFYESVHDNCGISDLDTKYAKYSLDDYDVKLKLAQTLLRISLLSETACYGAEISDVNHLLLECAELTIKENCPLGLSYLFNLPDDCLKNVKDVFKSLPQTEIYFQLFAYFCSIKLYSQLNPDYKNLFLFDPNELILKISNAEITDNDNQVVLKQLINSLLEGKQDEEDEQVEDEAKESYEHLEEKSNVENFSDSVSLKISNNSNKQSTLDYVPASDELGEWDDWSDKENVEIENETDNKSASGNADLPNTKLTLDYIPTTDDLGGWDDWSDKDNTETEVSVKNTSDSEIVEAVKEDNNNRDNKLELNESDLIHNIESLGEWGDWGDKSNVETESGIEEKCTNDKETEVKVNNSDDALKIESKLDYNPGSEDLDEWGDWADKESFENKSDIESPKKISSTGVQEENENSNKSDTKQKSLLDYVPVSEEVDEWGNDTWNNEWADESSNKIDDVQNEPEITPQCSEYDNLSDEEFYKIYKEKFSQIRTIDDYGTVKKLLLERPSIINLNADNGNLALDMIIKMKKMSVTSNNSFDETLLQEIKEFLHNNFIPTKVLIEFLKEKRDVFSTEQFICIELCSKNAALQKEAIDCIKNNYKSLNLNSIILEEIFFNNLTSSFSVSHDLYYKILEQVFFNRTLAEIEDNVKLLIKNLVEQNNIPHALALLNQLEGIPPALSTYTNCFELLLRK